MTSEILKVLEKDGLDIMMCRSQGYDNAATMAGIHGGVQALIKEKNNLCGQHSFAENVSSVSFVGIFDALYSFFAASTHRWEVLVSVKRLSTTGWSVHHAAIKPVAHNCDGVVDAVETLCDRSENLETRGGAERLLPSVNDFTFLCYLYFWFDVLEEVEAAQQYLQTKKLTLDKVITKIEALRIFLLEEREDIVENSIEKALRKAAEFGISTEKRTRYRKKMPGEEGEIRHEAPSVKEENRRGNA